MNKMLTGILTSVALLCGTLAHPSTCNSTSACDSSCPTLKCYRRRSDSRHKYIQLVGSVDKAHIGDAESMYGVCTITPGYRGSFKPTRIAQCLFGDHLTGVGNCCEGRNIKIEGSAITNRDPKAWLADYFYLPRNYKGSFSVKPTIKTFFADLDLFVGLDDWLCGLYFRAWGDIVHTSWNLGFCDKPGIDGPAPLDHPEGYFSPLAYEGANLVQTFAEYAKGGTPEQSNPSQAIKNALLIPGGPGNGVGIENSNLKFQALRYAKMLNCSRSETGFADLRFELGWDFWQSECYHLGLNVQFAAPTGQKKEQCILFDAMVGNGNHWEVGGGVTGHYVFWKSEDSERHFSFHLDVNLTHLFKERMLRTFDLKNRANSAYMLAARFGPNGPEDPPDDQVGTSPDGGTTFVPTSLQFAGEYAPVANLTTTSVDVSIGIQADIVVMMNYTCGSFSCDLGYNFWGHSCEKFDCSESCKNSQSICNTSQQKTWGLKGDARMFGYDRVGEGTPAPNGAFPLSATQSGACLLRGLNNTPVMERVINILITPVVDPAGGVATDNNRNIDSPSRALEDQNSFLFTLPRTSVAASINTSKSSVLLKCDDIDFTRIKGTSHTIFTNLSYSWDRECWTPHLGLGIAAEFGSNNSCCDDDISKTSTGISCGPCLDCSVSQWSVWVQGGLAFN